MLDPQRILSPEEQAMFRLRELYRRHGYLPYKMSKFEEYDLYVRNKSFLASDRVLTFTDTDGKLMALKPDVTLSIVKNTRDTGGFQKVYYHENVYRPSPTSYGYREIPQAGLECIGPLDLAATAEVVMLAARSLESIDPGYLLDLSHLGLTAGLLAPLDLEEEQERAVLRALEAKNTSALRQLGAAAGVPGELTEALCRLALLYDRPSAALPALAGLTAGRPQAEAALGELRDLYALLGQYGLEDRLRLDFSLVNDQNYYSGIVFRGFLPGIASAVLWGTTGFSVPSGTLCTRSGIFYKAHRMFRLEEVCALELQRPLHCRLFGASKMTLYLESTLSPRKLSFYLGKRDAAALAEQILPTVSDTAVYAPAGIERLNFMMLSANAVTSAIFFSMAMNRIDDFFGQDWQALAAQNLSVLAGFFSHWLPAGLAGLFALAFFIAALTMLYSFVRTFGFTACRSRGVLISRGGLLTLT